MKLVKADTGGNQVIQKYGGGGFVVSGQAFEGAVIVLPDETRAWAMSGAFDTAQPADIQPVLDAVSGVEVCLLGCGARMTRPAADVRAAFEDAGVAIDLMDTGAACRTFNLLMGEGRPVAAALLPV